MQRYSLFVIFILVTMKIPIAHAAKHNIGIIVFDGFLTSDVTAPIEVFGAATKKAWFSSYNVVVISATHNKTVLSEEGLTIQADATIYDSAPVDVLIVPSAYDMSHTLNNRNLISFIKKHHSRGAWMASNCSGAFLLGEAGVLDGKKATTWAGGEAELAKSYPKVKTQVNQNVVIDDKLITSNGGPVSYQSAFALLEKLSSPEYATAISESIQFNRLRYAFKPLND